MWSMDPCPHSLIPTLNMWGSWKKHCKELFRTWGKNWGQQQRGWMNCTIRESTRNFTNQVTSCGYILLLFPRESQESSIVPGLDPLVSQRGCLQPCIESSINSLAQEDVSGWSYTLTNWSHALVTFAFTLVTTRQLKRPKRRAQYPRKVGVLFQNNPAPHWNSLKTMTTPMCRKWCWFSGSTSTHWDSRWYTHTDVPIQHGGPPAAETVVPPLPNSYPLTHQIDIESGQGTPRR